MKKKILYTIAILVTLGMISLADVFYLISEDLEIIKTTVHNTFQN